MYQLHPLNAWMPCQLRVTSRNQQDNPFTTPGNTAIVAMDKHGFTNASLCTRYAWVAVPYGLYYLRAFQVTRAITRQRYFVYLQSTRERPSRSICNPTLAAEDSWS